MLGGHKTFCILPRALHWLSMPTRTDRCHTRPKCSAFVWPSIFRPRAPCPTRAFITRACRTELNGTAACNTEPFCVVAPTEVEPHGLRCCSAQCWTADYFAPRCPATLWWGNLSTPCSVADGAVTYCGWREFSGLNRCVPAVRNYFISTFLSRKMAPTEVEAPCNTPEFHAARGLTLQERAALLPALRFRALPRCVVARKGSSPPHGMRH